MVLITYRDPQKGTPNLGAGSLGVNFEVNRRKRPAFECTNDKSVTVRYIRAQSWQDRKAIRRTILILFYKTPLAGHLQLDNKTSFEDRKCGSTSRRGNDRTCKAMSRCHTILYHTVI